MRYQRMGLHFRNACFLFFFFSSFNAAYGQVVAGIKANGIIINGGDTVNVCKGSSIRYESSASGSLIIQWRFNSGTPSAGSGIGPLIVTYNTAGYDTTFQRVDGSGGFSDSTYIIVRVSDVHPVAGYNFNPDNVCGNIPILFTNTSTGDAPLSYLWNYGDGSTDITVNTSHQFLTAIGVSGTQVFPVKLVVTNPLGCKDSITKPVTIQRIPDASIGNGLPGVVTFGVFNGIPTFKRCATELFYTFQFTNASTTNAIHTSYTIQWGDGSPDSVFATWPAAAVISHTFPRGSSNMTISVTGSNGCIGIKNYLVFLGTNPAGGLASLGNTDICSSEPLSFDISGASTNPSGTQYIFTINDGSQPQVFQHPPPATVTHFFSTGSCGISSSNGASIYPNSYGAYLTITNPCGSTSPAVVPIYVSGKPRPSFSIPSPVVCINTNVPIQNTSNYGSVVTSTGTTSSSCTNTGKFVWEIFPATGYTVAGSLGSFNGSPTNGLLWTSGTNTINLNFTLAGTYTIKITVYNERCGVVASIRTICVRNPPLASFTKSQNKSCGPATVNFTNTSPSGGCQGDSYLWEVTYADPENCAAGSGNGYSFVSGTTATSVSPVINFSRAGRYAIKLTTTAINSSVYCNKAFAFDTFYVVGPPVATVSNIGGICVNNSITPSATVSACYADGPVTYQWTFAGGVPATANTLLPGSILYSTVGIYPIRFIVKDEGCNQSDTVDLNVIVGDRPVAEAGNNASICSGQPVPIGMTPITGVTYLWTPSTGLNNPNIANPIATLTYTGPSSDTTYKIYLTASQGTNCSSLDSVEIMVKKKPVLTVNPAAVDLCLGDSTRLTAAGANLYAWTPAASLNFSDRDTVMAAPIVTTVYTITGSATNGCTDVKTITVTVRPKPTAEAGNDANICSGTPVPIGMSPAAGIAYQWTPAIGLSGSTIANPVATLFYNGAAYDTTYTFYLTASLGSFCSSNDSVKITVRRKPLVSITPLSASICLGDSVILTASGAEAYTWSPAGSLNSSSQPVVTAKPLVTTTYTVTGNLQNACTDNKNVTVTVNLHARAEFTANPIILCAPVNLNTVITPVPYPLQNNLYRWYVDGVLIGSNSTGIFPSYFMNTPADTVVIKLVAISATGCRADSMEVTLITRPSIAAAFAKDKDSSCSPLTVNFTNNTPVYANTQYLWDFGNGITSTLYTPPTVTFTASPNYRDTVYYIRLSANNGCVTTIKTDSVKVFAHSQARFGPNSPTGCSPFPVIFSNTSVGNNFIYYWDFGDGRRDTTYANGTLSHTYITGIITTYTVRLIAQNRCERDTQTISLLVSPNTINVAVQANGNQLSGCAPHTVTFNNSSVGAAQLTWNFGDGTPLVLTPNSQTSVTHTYQFSGNFIVTVRLQNSCSDTLISRNITVFSKPVADFTVINPIVCPGTTVSFSNTSQNADSYQWLWGDGGTGVGQNGQHSYANAGIYQVTLVALKVHPSGFVCPDTTRKTVDVRSKILASSSITNNKPCVPYAYSAAALNAANALLVEWFITSTANPLALSYYTGQNMTHTFTAAGTYQVKLIVHTATACKDSVTSTVTVYNVPAVTFTPLNTITCNHDTTISFLANAVYAGSDPLQYKWFINGVQHGIGNPYSNRFAVPVTASSATTFTIQSLAQNIVGCGDTSLPAKVIVNPLPLPRITVSPAYVLQQPDYTFTFKDTAVADPDKFYTWYMGDRSLRVLNGREISYQYGDTGTYKVKLNVINYQTTCSAADSVNVTILYVPGYLYIPNAMCMGCSNNALKRFLPLGKGLKNYHLTIYNSWGQKIFETTRLNANGAPDEAWDGTVNGKLLQQDAYTWKIEARYINNTEWKGMIYPGSSKPTKSGFITIIK